MHTCGTKRTEDIISNLAPLYFKIIVSCLDSFPMALILFLKLIHLRLHSELGSVRDIRSVASSLQFVYILCAAVYQQTSGAQSSLPLVL